MNTRTCNKCGWVFPPTYDKNNCQFCGGTLSNRYCCSCGILAEHVNSKGQCRACQRATLARNITSRLVKDQASYEDWISTIKSLPVKPLTEEQWLKACAHFDGCSMCYNKSIDARLFFIPFKFGGRYCSWNIIPVCEECAIKLRSTLNPWHLYSTNPRKGSNTQKRRYRKFKAVVEYLQGEIDEVQK